MCSTNFRWCYSLVRSLLVFCFSYLHFSFPCPFAASFFRCFFLAFLAFLASLASLAFVDKNAVFAICSTLEDRLLTVCSIGSVLVPHRSSVHCTTLSSRYAGCLKRKYSSVSPLLSFFILSLYRLLTLAKATNTNRYRCHYDYSSQTRCSLRGSNLPRVASCLDKEGQEKALHGQLPFCNYINAWSVKHTSLWMMANLWRRRCLELPANNK